MAMQKVILVTGVANFWGAQLASKLIATNEARDDLDYHVIGLDVKSPDIEIKGLDFVQADVRNPLLIELIRSESVHTLCHLLFSEHARHTETTFDGNVMGTMKVLGACSEAGVKKVVIKSSMRVYGARPSNPAFIREDFPLHGSMDYGYNRHLVEIEAFCNGYRRQVPEMIFTTLRYSSIVGPKADTPMTRFLKKPLAPVLLGFDPLMQVIHEKDVVASLVHATINDVPGEFNVAAKGHMPLSRVLALAAKIPLPILHLSAYWGAKAVNSIGGPGYEYLPIEPDYLRYPWVGDLSKMDDELGFDPQYAAEEALREFAGEQRLRRYMPGADALAYDEQRLYDTIERRRRARERGS